MPDFREDDPYNAIDGVSNGHPGLVVAFGGHKFPRCFHSWRKTSHGAWAYGECKKCGRRRARQSATLMGPVDLHWVLTGEEKEMNPPMPATLVRIGGMPPADATPEGPIGEVPDDAAGWAGTD